MERFVARREYGGTRYVEAREVGAGRGKGKEEKKASRTDLDVGQGRGTGRQGNGTAHTHTHKDPFDETEDHRHRRETDEANGRSRYATIAFITIAGRMAGDIGLKTAQRDRSSSGLRFISPKSVPKRLTSN